VVIWPHSKSVCSFWCQPSLLESLGEHERERAKAKQAAQTAKLYAPDDCGDRSSGGCGGGGGVGARGSRRGCGFRLRAAAMSLFGPMIDILSRSRLFSTLAFLAFIMAVANSGNQTVGSAPTTHGRTERTERLTKLEFATSWRPAQRALVGTMNDQRCGHVSMTVSATVCIGTFV